MNTLIGGMFTENGKEIGKVIDQRPERGRNIKQLGTIESTQAKDSIRITITGVYLAGGSVNGNKSECEIVVDETHIPVIVENAEPNERGKTTDVILSLA